MTTVSPYPKLFGQSFYLCHCKKAIFSGLP
ncbi:hypothetical protein pdam_00016027, partial [Pocillopora damicornis]